ncbi:MAG: PEP-CTERM sorting domain-containing protein [Verrucomicrobiota bacterium]
MSIQKTLIAAAVVGMALSSQAQQLSYTFDTDAQGFQHMPWTAGPAGWSGGAAIQAQPTVGGWTLGGSFNFYKEFGWNNGQQEMQQIAATGNGHISFDLIMDGATSFNSGASGWYQMELAGNSAGAHGWTQLGNIFTAGTYHDASDMSLVSQHFDYTFSQLGWGDAEDAAGWFQIYFGANSDSAFPVKFYLDNVNCYVVPEPSTLALAGLGSAAMLVLRRRK